MFVHQVLGLMSAHSASRAKWLIDHGMNCTAISSPNAGQNLFGGLHSSQPAWNCAAPDLCDCARRTVSGGSEGATGSGWPGGETGSAGPTVSGGADGDTGSAATVVSVAGGVSPSSPIAGTAASAIARAPAAGISRRHLERFGNRILTAIMVARLRGASADVATALPSSTI